MTPNWRASEEFGALCDLVASDHLVCLTGAGISRGMKRKYPRGSRITLPGWLDLLRELLATFKPEMTPADAAAADELLDPVDERPAVHSLNETVQHLPSGTTQADALTSLKALGPLIASRELILAASLIRKANPHEFDEHFREAIAEAPGQCSDTHLAILDVLPRGILTFNYDGGHEEACRRRNRPLTLLNPTDEASEEQFRSLLEHHLKTFFVLKAHGSVDSTHPLVLTIEEYRSLLAKNPSFRAFVQNLFTNFNFLMVGYGLDDPDFDLFLRTMAEQFGDPLQQHVVIRPIAQKHRREIVERRLYGIRTLHVGEFLDIPKVLQAAATVAGPKLQRSLDACLSRVHDERDRGHAALRELGPAGRTVAGAALLPHLSDSDSFVVSETAYSLGVLDVERYKDYLCRLVDERSEAEVLGRTLTVLRGAFKPRDLPQIRDWLARFTATPPSGPRAERIIKYLDYLLVYVENKYQSDPHAPRVVT